MIPRRNILFSRAASAEALLRALLLGLIGDRRVRV
jgi:hypothetical protein